MASSLLTFPNKDNFYAVFDVPWVSPENLHDLDSNIGGVIFMTEYQYSDQQIFYEFIPAPETLIPAGSTVVGLTVWLFQVQELGQDQNELEIQFWLAPGGIQDIDAHFDGLLEVNGAAQDLAYDDVSYGQFFGGDPAIYSYLPNYDVLFSVIVQLQNWPTYHSNSICALDAVGLEIFYDEYIPPPEVDDGYIRSKRSRARGWA